MFFWFIFFSTIPTGEDYLLATLKPCARYNMHMVKYLNESNLRGLFEQHKSLISYIEENSGFKMRSITRILFLWDCLHVEQLKGKR